LNLKSADVESVESIAGMGYDIDAEHYVEEISKDRKEQLAKMMDNSRINNDRVKIIFKVGKPVDEILKAIVKEFPDLVVMGTRGRSNLKNSFMGNAAEKVFKRSPVTVLSYRDKDVKESLMKKIHI